MNLKIKGLVNVVRYKWVDGVSQSFTEYDGEIPVKSQLVIKDFKALVWSFKSNPGIEKVERKTYTFTFEETEISSYTTYNGNHRQKIIFFGKRGYDGFVQARESLELNTFDNFETCDVYMYYFDKRGQFCRVPGCASFSQLEEDSKNALRKLYLSLDFEEKGEQRVYS